MKIADYFPYFHDGSIIDIKYNDSSIIISMESAEISPEENKDNIALSEHSTFKGKLHLEGVGTITDNDKKFTGVLRMLSDSAGILHLDIQDKSVTLGLEWVNYPPHPNVSAYSFYNIEVKKVWWENIPDLYDPFW